MNLSDLIDGIEDGIDGLNLGDLTDTDLDTLASQVNTARGERARKAALPANLRAAALAYAETGEDPVTFVTQVMATHAADSQNGEA